MSTEIDDQKLARRLLIVDVVLKRAERLVLMTGQAALTPVRVAELVAEEALRDIDGFNLEQFHVCPGYGDTHVSTMANYVRSAMPQLIQRCHVHPERRTGERRK